MKWFGLFAWLLVPLGLWLAVLVWGTPHIVVSYRFNVSTGSSGNPHDPRVPRDYIDCTYWGLEGSITVPATDRRCPWIRMVRGDG
ncbi:MAG: hypothetical protein AAGG79_05620 [Pseudomonadota bacterium]